VTIPCGQQHLGKKTTWVLSRKFSSALVHSPSPPQTTSYAHNLFSIKMRWEGFILRSLAWCSRNRAPFSLQFWSRDTQPHNIIDGNFRCSRKEVACPQPWRVLKRENTACYTSTLVVCKVSNSDFPGPSSRHTEAF